MPKTKVQDDFTLGGIAALETLEVEFIRSRDVIEAGEPLTVDAVLELIRMLLDDMRGTRLRKV